MRLSGIDLEKATGGDWRKGMPESITGISTDTRRFIKGHAFLALRGPNFDGHQFASKIVSNAHALIGDSRGIHLWNTFETPQLEVKDTLTALGDIANAWRARLNHTTVIAITGSYGKTTVRSMLAHIFKSLGVQVAATHANLNNLIGVPTTLLGIDESTEVALIECGISETGEMERLSQIVQPDIAVITGISAAHSSGLGGIDAIAQEKGSILSHLLPQGWCVFGSGVSQQINRQSAPHVCIDMDKPDDTDADVAHWNLQDRKLQLSRCNGESGELTLALPARHWAANMALAATIVLKYFKSRSIQQAKNDVNQNMPTLQSIANILSGWQPVDGRMAVASGINGSRILDDTYNANPVSMQVALDTLSQLSGHKTAIIGTMAELEDSTQAHASLDVSHIDTLILVGKEMQALKTHHPEALWFAATDEAVAWIKDNLDRFGENDDVLIKASRSMQFDRIVRVMLKKEGIYAL